MFNKLLKGQKARLEEEIKEIEKTIQKRKQYLENINHQVVHCQSTLGEVQNQLFEAKTKMAEYQQDLGIAEGVIAMQELGMEYTPDCNDLDELAVKKVNIQNSIASLINNNEAIITTRVYRIDGSEAKGRQFQKTFCENLLIGFNSYYNKKKKSVTQANITKIEELLKKKFITINNKAGLMGVCINQEYLSYCIRLLYTELDEKIAKTEERERIKEEKRRLREQEKLLAEADKERKKLEEERHNLQKLFTKAITEQEQEDIKNKLAEVDKRTEEIDWRISHQSAGWLYIATTPCLEGMYKAGCTKQLNPLNRLAQLSSASVPYPFECHGLVFSEDVFDLEAKLHKRLDSVRVNKMNRGKEFFYGSPEEAIKILKEEFKVDVHFVDENWVEEE